MAGLTTHDRVHLAVCLTAPPDQDVLRQIGEACGVSSYDLRLRLRGDVPKPLACCASVEAAEAKARRLNDMGVTTIVYVQSDLPPKEPFAVFSLSPSASELRCSHRRGETIAVPKHDIALLVLGKRIMTHSATEVDILPEIVPTPRGNLILPSGSRTTQVRRDELFLMLFRRAAEAPALLLNERGVDYACLGRRRQTTHQQSMRLLLADLRMALPDVPFDERLMKGQSNNRGEAFYNRRLTDDSSTANATLIYWQMLAEQSGRRHFTAPRVSQA